MRLLVIGGTVFLGRHIAEAALARGHELTLFNRGHSSPGGFPGAECLTGDREKDLSALAGRRWDSVIDTCGYLPRVVRASAKFLAGQVERYVFVSSAAIYEPPPDETGVLTEESPVLRPDPPDSEDVARNYGALKARCEQAVLDELPGRALSIRPGLIVGPLDPTGRFTYWVRRIAAGGKILAPGPPDRAVQFVDVRDLAAWIVEMAEKGRTGVFNAAAPPLPLAAVLLACRAEVGGAAEFVWVTEEFVLGHGLVPFLELPLWLPRSQSGLLRMDATRPARAGLHARPLAATVRDTLRWLRANPSTPVAGLDREKETALLHDWKARRQDVVRSPDPGLPPPEGS